MLEEFLDVGFAVGAEVDEVGVFVNVEDEERNGTPNTALVVDPIGPNADVGGQGPMRLGYFCSSNRATQDRVIRRRGSALRYFRITSPIVPVAAAAAAVVFVFSPAVAASQGSIGMQMNGLGGSRGRHEAANVKQPKTITYHDKSNVGIEHQVTEMVKNQMQHNMALSIMASQMRLLETAISERL